MTWSLTATGHCKTETEEAELVTALRELVADREVYNASVSTMFHGQVDLLKKEEEKD